VAQLIVQDSGQTYLIDLTSGERLVVGRSHDCDIPIRADRASRRHAAFEPAQDGHEIADLGSTNGTLLNGAPFAHAMRLSNGDTIDIGGCRILYRIVTASGDA
jgi:pSer/pThr/pTyr-binding forkhead associated (FHA) protein